MSKPPIASSKSEGCADLRQRTEQNELRETPTPISGIPSAQESQQLVHELRVHQIELEMQNEELRRVQQELALSGEKYVDLYDLAPVGYCSIDEFGIIREANLTLAVLLEVNRSTLIRQPFSRFVLPEQQDLFRQFHHRLLEEEKLQLGELQMMNPGGNGPFWVEIKAKAETAADGSRLCRAAISDITERKQMESVHAFLQQCSHLGPEQDFFEFLARYLAECLHMDYVCIDRLEGDSLIAQTVAVYSQGKFEDNVRYTLKDTPCGDVVGKNICCFPQAVRQLFPRDAILQELMAESYVGATLWSSREKPIGLIAVIGKRPLVHRHLAESVIGLVSVRAAGELERREIEGKLRASLEWYRLLFNSGNDAIFLLEVGNDGLPGRILEANETMSRQLGYTREELLNLSLRDIDFPTEASHVPAIMQQLEKKRNHIFEAAHVAKDGTRIPVELSAHLIEWEGRACCLSIARDLTERNREQNRYRTILRTTLDGFMIVDHEGRLLEVNNAYCVMSGYSRQELLKMQVADLEAVETPEQVRLNLGRLIKEEGGRFETRHRRKDQTIIDVEINIQTAGLTSNQLICFLRDITQRKRMMETLQKRTLELEKFNKAMLGRESRIIELKEEVNQLCSELGREVRYPPVWKKP